MSKIRVLLADDHALVREGVRLLLEAQGDIEVVAEAAEGREAVEKASSAKPDVAILDISMPRMSGLEATREIKFANPETRILILTMHGTDDYFFRALEAGASGYVLKDAVSADLIAAVRAVYQGDVFLYPSVAKRLLHDYLKRVSTGEERTSYDSLTEREREVFKLIGEGLTSQEIAAHLTLSINTVQTHRSNIMKKLNLHSRAELMKFAIRVGLLKSETT